MADRKELLRRLFERGKAVHNELVRIEGISLLGETMKVLGLDSLRVEPRELTRALGPYLFFAAPPRLVSQSFRWRLSQGLPSPERALLDDLRERAIFGAWELSFDEGQPWALGVPPIDDAEREPARLARALDAEQQPITRPGLYAGLWLPMNIASQRGRPPGDGVGPWLIFGREISEANADALREFGARRGWSPAGRFDAFDYACDVLIASVRPRAPRSPWSDLLFDRQGAGSQLDTYVRTTMLRMVREGGLAHPELGRVHWSVALSAVDDEADLLAMAGELCERLREWNSRYYYGRDNRLAGVDHEVRRRLQEWTRVVAEEGDEEDEVAEQALGAMPIEELPIDGELLARAGAPTKGPLSTLKVWLDAHRDHGDTEAIGAALRRLRWRLRWRRAFGEFGVQVLQEALLGCSYRDDSVDFPALRDVVRSLYPELGARTIASLPWEVRGSRSRLLKGLGRGQEATVGQLFEEVVDPAELPGVGESTADDAAYAVLSAVYELDQGLVARFGVGAQAARDEAAAGLDALEAFFDD